MLSSPIKSWFIDRIVAAGQKTEQLKPIHDYMATMFLNDFRLAMLFTGLTFALAYAYLKSKLSADLFVVALIILVVFDLFRIDYRGETYTDNSKTEEMFVKPEYINAIERDAGNSIYRVLNLKQDGSIGSLNQNSNFLAYFLMYDIYGYSGIKPRAIQDYYDILGSPANPTFWRMLNVEYIIFDKQINYPGFTPIFTGAKTFVYKNENALPRIYFVNKVEKKNAIETINAVKQNSFDPADVAFVEDEISGIVPPDSTAFVNISEFKDEKVTLNVKATGNNFLFFGDTYLPYGWTATIDGNETKIYKANHGFRGIVVPVGEHKIEFVYAPKSFAISKYLALILSSVSFAGLIFGIVLYRKEKLKKLEE